MPESNTSRWPRYARVPPFLPVPVRARADGWTVERQVRFIGYLAETGSVGRAAQRVAMSRESAWRLRGRAGAASFAYAWDTVIALHREGLDESVTLPKRKVTPDELAERGDKGAIHVMMRRGKFVGAQRKPSVSALLRHMRRLDALAVRGGWGG
jgi:hypothetical protein